MKAHIPSHPPHSTLRKKSSLLLSKPEMKVVSMKGVDNWHLRGMGYFIFSLETFRQAPWSSKKGVSEKKEDASLKTSAPPRHQARMKKH